MTLLSILFWILAATIYGTMAAYLFRHPTSIFAYWQNRKAYISFWSNQSWLRKYKSPLEPMVDKNWYYRIFEINYRERFPLSATLFVFVTDFYHLAQFFMITCLVFALIFTRPQGAMDLLLAFVIYRVLWSAAFEFGYSFLALKKTWRK